MVGAWLLPLAIGLPAFPSWAAISQEAPAIALPSDPIAAIVTLDWAGGLSAPRINMNPALTIRANGTMTVTDRSGRLADIDSALSRDQVQELLRFIVNDQQFFSINIADIRAAIAEENRRTGTGIGVADAPDTIVRIRTADKESELRFNALSVFANRYPAIQALAQFRAVETRLRFLFEESRIGGRQALAAALAEANAYLKQQNPAPAPLTTENYLRTLQSPERKTVQFARDQGDGTNLVVTILYLAGQPPTITAQTQKRPPF
jgi:hypothetical protein